MYRSPSYLQWIKEADQIILMTKRGPLTQVRGPFFALLELHTLDKRRRKDADNRIKAALDYATRVGIIEDDKFAQWVLTGWVDDPSTAPAHGARLSIWPWKKEGLPDVAALIAKLIQVPREKQGAE